MVSGLGIKERRETPRMPIHRCGARVRRCVWRLWVPTGPEHTATVFNLGSRGLALRGQQHYRLGEHVAVTLYSKGGGHGPKDSLTLRGRVMWCAAPGGSSRETVGIQFTGRPQAVRQRIAAWASRNKSRLF